MKKLFILVLLVCLSGCSLMSREPVVNSAPPVPALVPALPQDQVPNEPKELPKLSPVPTPPKPAPRPRLFHGRFLKRFQSQPTL